MLLIEIGRGWISDNDGFNENYFLHNSKWYFLISPCYSRSVTDHFHLIELSDWGDIRPVWLDSPYGGVQFLELCYKYSLCRGRISEINPGINDSFYLFSKRGFRMISPSYQYDLSLYVMYVDGSGIINNSQIFDVSGVLIYLHGLCYSFS